MHFKPEAAHESEFEMSHPVKPCYILWGPDGHELWQDGLSEFPLRKDVKQPHKSILTDFANDGSRLFVRLGLAPSTRFLLFGGALACLLGLIEL
jgi:hypothetical protein